MKKRVLKTIGRLIKQGETQFKVVPLLIFRQCIISSMFLKFYQISKDRPEISYEISEPLGTHDYMVDLVENVFKMLKFLPLIMRLY